MMTAETVLMTIFRINLVGSIAILLVLVLRPLALRRFGASVTYWLWLVVPIAVALSVLPAREQIVTVYQPALSTTAAYVDEPVANAPAMPGGAPDQAAPIRFVSRPVIANALVAVWLLGAFALFGQSMLSARRLAADPSIGPALVGVFRPKLVLPEDFEARFDADERALILAHEEVHRVSGHTIVNALVEVARCTSWFNPLVHLAAIRARSDQELACDAAVIAARPTARRAYAEALLKTQVSPALLKLGCTWTSQSAERLRERIAMLGRPSLSRHGAAAGTLTVAAVGLALGYAAWAQQPERLVTQTSERPEAVWTPSSDAPPDTLSHALEGQRHDFFIELAQAGDIDLVFFGTTDTEMWWWERGRDVWDREFGSLKAANFGSQGTQPRSLLWRMRNGELDGYEAKLIVLQSWGPGPGSAIREEDRAELIAGFVPIIAEVRARQPQARLLIMAPLPRGRDLEQWRWNAASIDEALNELADGETIFYANLGEGFFNPDGSFKSETWSVGRREPGFEIWAEALQPWLDRFVR